MSLSLCCVSTVSTRKCLYLCAPWPSPPCPALCTSSSPATGWWFADAWRREPNASACVWPTTSKGEKWLLATLHTTDCLPNPIAKSKIQAGIGDIDLLLMLRANTYQGAPPGMSVSQDVDSLFQFTCCSYKCSALPETNWSIKSDDISIGKFDFRA